jgi:hypothetical protein
MIIFSGKSFLSTMFIIRTSSIFGQLFKKMKKYYDILPKNTDY